MAPETKFQMTSVQATWTNKPQDNVHLTSYVSEGGPPKGLMLK